MNIAQVAPLIESVPPKKYGGTERVVSYLTEELVRQGHQVTLFASSDSITCGELVSPGTRSLRLNRGYDNVMIYYYLMFEELKRRQSDFDVIHFHTEYHHYPFFKNSRVPWVTTLHGRMDLPELRDLYGFYSGVPVVSISDHQRIPLPGLNWVSTVYHGLPSELYKFNRRPKKYLAFIGRISPEKGIDRAIEISRASGVPLKIAAKVDVHDFEYYQRKILPLLKQSPTAEFIGEITDREKNEFLGNAEALLLPIRWPEPFGLVMIEAMACGTPVIAFSEGSVPEIVENGVNGFIVKNIDEALRAIDHLSQIDRTICRRSFEDRFSIDRCAREYVALYQVVRPYGLRKKSATWKTSSNSAISIT